MVYEKKSVISGGTFEEGEREGEEGGKGENIHLSSSRFPQSFVVPHEWHQGWGSPPTLQHECRYVK